MALAIAVGGGRQVDSTGARQVLLVDDHALVRVALKLLLETSLGYSVAEAGTADAAVADIRQDPPDVVLLDVGMPVRDGLWALERIRALRPRLPVVMLSSFDDADHVRAALNKGASGYVLKEAAVSQIADAVDTAISGRGVYIDPVVAQQILTKANSDDPRQLTDREAEVLHLLARGATNEEIASALFVTEKTVKTHLTSIFRKLAVSNRTQAATKALRDGLLGR